MFQALRLLLFKDCNRSCAGCCNKDWDLDALPKIKSYLGYSSIMLTGGEPLLRPDLILQVVKEIKKENNCPIYIYTAKTDNMSDFLKVLDVIDGVTLTLHDRSDIEPFNRLTKEIFRSDKYYNKSLRLNIFKEVNHEKVNHAGWLVKKDMVWIKDCSLPENEVFMRL